MAMILPSTIADATLANRDNIYDGPALFCILAILALSLGSTPINTIQGLANSSGEYQRKPTTIVASAHTSTAHGLIPIQCMEPLRSIESENLTEIGRLYGSDKKASGISDQF